MADFNGNLQFFVNDGLIYDNNGEFIDHAWTTEANLSVALPLLNSMSPYTINIANSNTNFHGQETVIVPHPTKCNWYFIFGSYVTQDATGEILPGKIPGDEDSTGTPPTPIDPIISSTPIYCLYDATTKEVIKRGTWYGGPTYLDEYVYQSIEIFNTNSTSSVINTNGDLPVMNEMWSDQTKENGCLSLGATQLRADGTRFVLCFLNTHLYIIQIQSDGELRYWKRFDHIDITNNSTKRSELEVVFDENIQSYRVAFTMGFDGEILKVFELNSNMTTLLNEYTFSCSPTGSSEIISFYGLEFSPSTKKLYTTSKATYGLTNSINISTLHYIDFDLQSPTIIPLNLTNTQKLDYSYMEIGIDGNLYFASQSGIYKMTNPDIPDITNLSLNPIFSYQIDTSYAGNNLFTPTQRVFLISDNIDGMDYSDHLQDNIECCTSFSSYDKESFSTTSNGTWSAGLNNNPLATTNSNVVTIRDELRISRGNVVTINNMIIKFAPGAKLIIEEGDLSNNGAKLQLNNTILTLDERCGVDKVWEGVEVWGNNLLIQGNISNIPAINNTKQGRLVLLNNSKIEFAKIGVITLQNNNGVYNTNKAGGIIQASNSYFNNNQRGVVIANYISPNGNNNKSTFSNCFFITSIKNNDYLPINHIELRNVKGIGIYGCDFLNNIPNQFDEFNEGNGIYCINASFMANARCISNSFPCTSFDPNKFENLNRGILVSNANDILTFSSDRNEFINNNIGISAKGVILSKIIRNKFIVAEKIGMQTAGLYLTNCTRYQIEENDFSSMNLMNNDFTYGIVIRNSGKESNLVYKNKFVKLYIGCQSEGSNSNLFEGKPVGLVWKCNDYKSPIEMHDISSRNGSIAYNQGYYDPSSILLANQKASNNNFSLVGESNLYYQHDFSLSGSFPIQYVHVNGYNFIPDSYTNTLMSPYLVTINNNPVSYVEQYGCPSNLGKTIIDFQSEIISNKILLEQNFALLHKGASIELLEELNVGNVNSKLNILLEASPYLSDEILIAYINKNPSYGNLIQVILANSPLSKEVLSIIETKNYPFGIKNQINNNQLNALSKRDILNQNIQYLEELIFFNLDHIIREILLDPEEVKGFEELVSILSSRSEDFYKELLVNAYIIQNDIEKVNENINSTVNYGKTVELNNVLRNIRNVESVKNYFESSTCDLAKIVEIASDSRYCICSGRAQALLEYSEKLDGEYSFEIEISERSTIENQVGNSSFFIDSASSISILPNPVSNKFKLNSNIEEGLIQIYSFSGIIVYSQYITPSNNEIDISHLSTGSYLVNFISESKTTTIHIVKD
ncbi:MAG: T9SS type A sorting domain-containing protein [Flavobacteriia bacterium]|nr:T9SS type A sorting domain-containing protein [Flavobacteriia bacterium]